MASRKKAGKPVVTGPHKPLAKGAGMRAVLASCGPKKAGSERHDLHQRVREANSGDVLARYVVELARVLDVHENGERGDTYETCGAVLAESPGAVAAFERAAEVAAAAEERAYPIKPRKPVTPQVEAIPGTSPMGFKAGAVHQREHQSEKVSTCPLCCAEHEAAHPGCTACFAIAIASDGLPGAQAEAARIAHDMSYEGSADFQRDLES